MKQIGAFFFAVLIGLGVQGQDGPEKPVKNIILMIGDGLGVSQIYAAMTVSEKPLALEQFKDIGFAKTYSGTSYITDSGAAGTAIATGRKTYDAAIGVDMDTLPLRTILEYAEMNDKSTGIVVTSQVTHATPASFYSHQPYRYQYEEIASDLVNSNVEVFIGGGLNYFNKREDNQDLTSVLTSKGYFLATSLKDIERPESGKLAGLLYKDKPPRYSDGRNEMLPVSTAKTIELLTQEKNGFFLMIEGSQIDWGGHANDTEYTIEETLDFDKTIGIVLDFARQDENTLVIVTADHETGGMGLIEGDIAKGEVKADYATSGHTAVMVPVFAFGPGSENFRGIYENTELFDKMMDAFGFDQPNSQVF